MATTDLMVGIGAEYKGKSAFNKANKDVFGLQSAVKSLAKSYIGLAGAQKAYAFGKVSLKAFIADDAAAAQLTKTLQNLGLAFNSVEVEKFISKVQSTTGVLDDQLRPAFQSLLIATRDYAKAQNLLNLSLDISAGTGKDLGAVSQALSKAYLGNYASLTRLGGGISKATVASGNFDQIIQSLTDNFRGDALAAASTYKGQLNLLAVAADTAKESIGEGLVIALSKVSSGNITNLATQMDKLATSTAEVIVGIGIMVNKIKSIPGAGLLKNLFSLKSIPVLGTYLDIFQKLGKTEIKRVKDSKKVVENTKKITKSTTDNLKVATKLTAEQAKQLALKKSQALLDTSSKVMDMDLIQNTAALMGKVTEDESLRLRLQQAILLGNAEAAGNLSQQLLASQIAAMKLSGTNPLDGWPGAFDAAIKALQQLRNELALLGAAKVAIPTMGGGMTGGNSATDAPYTTVVGGVAISTPWDTGAGQSNYSQGGSNFTYNQGNPLAVQVFVDPNAMAYGINAAVVNANANGSSPTVVRNGFFNYGG